MIVKSWVRQKAEGSPKGFTKGLAGASGQKDFSFISKSALSESDLVLIEESADSARDRSFDFPNQVNFCKQY